MVNSRPLLLLWDIGAMYRSSLFNRFAKWTARAAGHPVAFIGSILIVLAWIITGPIFHFSDTWQLVINTATTIVTFLMVFLIQNTQKPRQRGDPAEAGRIDPGDSRRA
jgi:low affinity Fe/Cu permease